MSDPETPAAVRVKLGSVAFLRAAGSGYGIGLDDDGHRVEFLGDWRAMRELTVPLAAGEPVYTHVESWQVLAVDDELRVDLSREAAIERARLPTARHDQRPEPGRCLPPTRAATTADSRAATREVWRMTDQDTDRPEREIAAAMSPDVQRLLDAELTPDEALEREIRRADAALDRLERRRAATRTQPKGRPS